MALRKMGQRLGPARRANKIGDDENEGSSLHDPKISLEKIAQVRRGRTGTLGPRKHPVEDVDRVAPAAPRRNHRIYLVTIEQRSDAIAVTGQEPRQHGDEFGRHETLLDMGAEIHRRAQVQQEPRRNFSIFIVHPDIGCQETRGDVPIDVTDIVVILVLAQIGQIQPETAKQSLIIAMKQPVQPANDGPLQSPQYGLSRGAGACSSSKFRVSSSNPKPGTRDPKLRLATSLRRL